MREPTQDCAVRVHVAASGGWVWRISYTSETHAPSGTDRDILRRGRRVNVPVWAGVGAIVIGGGLLLFGRKAS